MKPREDIVAECARAAQACFNYYADEPLTAEQVQEIEQQLDSLLPVSVTTEDWQEMADEYNARVAAEDECNARLAGAS